MSDAPWRRVGVRYAADELYIDLMERIDAVVDANTGMLRTAEVGCALILTLFWRWALAM